MLSAIFPGLNKSFFNPNKKISKFSKIAFICLFLVVVPLEAYLTAISVQENTLYIFMSGIVTLSIFGLLECYWTAVLSKAIDKYVFDGKSKLLRFVRCFFPLRLLLIYLRSFIFLIGFILPDSMAVFLSVVSLLLYLWLLINIFIILRRCFEYSTKKAVISIIIQGILILISIVI